jgi:hypothetical protein
MNAENIGDLFEVSAQIREYKQNGKQGSLQDAFETLGFKAGDFAGLSDMAQFDKIVERALSLQDESKASFRTGFSFWRGSEQTADAYQAVWPELPRPDGRTAALQPCDQRGR